MRLALLVAMAGCTAEPPAVDHEDDSPADTAEPDGWPHRGLSFRHPILQVPTNFGNHRVFVVAGHGAPGNRGNVGCRCQLEQDFTLRASEDLARRLDATGIFEVHEGRTGEDQPSYRRRLRALARSGAEVMIELHSDARSGPYQVTGRLGDGSWCLASHQDPGLAVLVSDRGGKKLNAQRLVLARSVANALTDAGFGMYLGLEYGGKYEADEVPGVYLDRRGLMMLRRPTVPSILIETHNAWDPREVARWDEPRTHDAFGRAITAALLDYFAVVD